jgi:hypothetical protein
MDGSYGVESSVNRRANKRWNDVEGEKSEAQVGIGVRDRRFR